MKNRFLLIAGLKYYPSSGTGNWIGTFKSREEALAEIETVEHQSKGKGPRDSIVEHTWTTYRIRGRENDWYEIVDLEGWM